jgi:hypothetical protein
LLHGIDMGSQVIYAFAKEVPRLVVSAAEDERRFVL